MNKLAFKSGFINYLKDLKPANKELAKAIGWLGISGAAISARSMASSIAASYGGADSLSPEAINIISKLIDDVRVETGATPVIAKALMPGYDGYSPELHRVEHTNNVNMIIHELHHAKNRNSILTRLRINKPLGRASKAISAALMLLGKPFGALFYSTRKILDVVDEARTNLSAYQTIPDKFVTEKTRALKQYLSGQMSYVGDLGVTYGAAKASEHLIRALKLIK